MLFPYWITLFLPVFAFPLVSHRHHEQVFALEQNGIAADNAAIRLGEGEAAWLDSLNRENRTLKKWDLAHHPVHACRPLPVVGAECLAADKVWETAIRVRHAQVGVVLQTLWQAARLAAEREISRVGGRGIVIRRPFTAPVRPVRCPVCALAIGWEVVRLPSTLVQVPAFPLQTVRVRLLPPVFQEKPSYELR